MPHYVVSIYETRYLLEARALLYLSSLYFNTVEIHVFLNINLVRGE